MLSDFPPKELRSVVDQGKKDIKKGIVISISTLEGKVGVAIGVTKDLVSKYDAVKFVKIASEILGGKEGTAEKILRKLVEIILKKSMKLLKQ